MLEYTEKIREIAKNILEDGTVDVFIGYKKGSVPMMNEPVLIRDPAKVDLLHWDSHCGLNLATYITKRTDKIGIVANGCNSRNIVTHILENQIKREQLYIVGVPCTAMIDYRSVRMAVGHREILDVVENGDNFTVIGKDFEETFQKKDFLRSNCFLCRRFFRQLHICIRFDCGKLLLFDEFLLVKCGIHCYLVCRRDNRY